VRQTCPQTIDQLPDGLRLITGRFHITNKLKFFAHRD
jgi:hypothetical protein